MGNNEEEACKLGLGVGEKYYAATQTKDDRDRGKKIKEPSACLRLDLCRFELFPKDADHDHRDHLINPTEGNSSLETNNKNNIVHVDDQEDHAGDLENKKNDGNNITNARKKLKLTKEQTTLLEGCFEFTTTLNPDQKRELAEQLNLKPRQVEVWFQNRRARTKTKQIEEDCGLLKKFCESLGQENQRLKKKLQELRSMKVEKCRQLRDIQYVCKQCKSNYSVSLLP